MTAVSSLGLFGLPFRARTFTAKAAASVVKVGRAAEKRAQKKIWYEINGKRILATPDRYQLILRQIERQETPAEAIPAPVYVEPEQTTVETPKASVRSAAGPVALLSDGTAPPVAVDLDGMAAQATVQRLNREQAIEAERIAAEQRAADEARIAAEHARIAAEVARMAEEARRAALRAAQIAEEDELIINMLLEAA